MDIKNPWAEIPNEPDYVLPQDAPFVRGYNRLCTEGATLWINLKYTPEPRLGPVDAPVYVLQANPSYDLDVPNGSPDPRAVAAELASIRDDHTPHLGISSDNPWWRKTLGQLARQVGRGKRRGESARWSSSPIGHSASGTDMSGFHRSSTPSRWLTAPRGKGGSSLSPAAPRSGLGPSRP